MSPRCETTCSRAQSRCQARNDGILAQHVMGELNRHCDGCCPCPRSPVAEKGAVTTSASGGDRGTRKKLAVSKEAAGSASQALAGSGKRWRSRPKNLAHSLASSRGRAAARKLAVCMAAAIALSLRASGADAPDTFTKADRHGMPFPPKDTQQRGHAHAPGNRIQNTSCTGDHAATQIIAFTDSNFVELANRWYETMQSLGYHDHELIIIATDKNAFDYFERLGSNVELTLSSGGADLWRTRLEVLERRLMAGHSVLLADVDNLFYRYVPMSSFESSGVRAAFMKGTTWPKRGIRCTRLCRVCGLGVVVSRLPTRT